MRMARYTNKRKDNGLHLTDKLLENAVNLYTQIFVTYVKISYFCHSQMEVVAQPVRAPDCGSGGHGFESRLPPETA